MIHLSSVEALYTSLSKHWHFTGTKILFIHVFIIQNCTINKQLIFKSLQNASIHAKGLIYTACYSFAN